jgi:hypothetical protein
LVSQLREDLLLCSSYLLLGVPNGLLLTSHQATFLAPLPRIEEEEAPTSTTTFRAPLSGWKKTSARGVYHTQSFTLFLFFFILLLLASFYQKYKKFSSLIVVTFTCLLLVLLEWVLMSTHASVLVDSVGPPSAEVCRAAASFP